MTETAETVSVSLVNKTLVKRFIKDLDGQTGGNLLDALSSRVETIVKDALGRAQANGRKQVRACDL